MTFVDRPNDELGAILKNRSHEIQVQISRAPKRIKLFFDVQQKKGRKPLFLPDPAGARWNRFIDETIRATKIMGDLCEVNILLAPNGEDFGMVKESERRARVQ
jgi:hypothetical protein